MAINNLQSENIKNIQNPTLLEALKKLQKEEKRVVSPDETTNFDIFVSNISKDKNLASCEITKYIGRGSSAIVFETSKGDILKLTNGRHYPLNRPQASFDVPIIKKGKIGNIYYYFEEKLYQYGLSEGFVKIMRDMIKKEGYRVHDLYDSDFHQIGMSENGKLYLLDPECAKYKTIFHALYDKAKRLINYRWVEAREIARRVILYLKQGGV